MTKFDTDRYSADVNRDVATMEVILDSFVGSADKVDEITDVDDVERDINYVVEKSTKTIGHVHVIKTDYGVRVDFELIPAKFTLAAYGTEE